jgi:hypothetical protein
MKLVKKRTGLRIGVSFGEQLEYASSEDLCSPSDRSVLGRFDIQQLL